MLSSLETRLYHLAPYFGVPVLCFGTLCGPLTLTTTSISNMLCGKGLPIRDSSSYMSIAPNDVQVFADVPSANTEKGTRSQN